MTDLTNKIRRDTLCRSAYYQGEMLGLSEVDILKQLVLLLVSLKDESLQEKIDAAMRSVTPLIIPMEK